MNGSLQKKQPAKINYFLQHNQEFRLPGILTVITWENSKGVCQKSRKLCALTHFNDKHLFKYLDSFNILLWTFQSIAHELQTPSIWFMLIWGALSYLLLQLFGDCDLVLKSCKMPFKVKGTLHWFFVTGRTWTARYRHRARICFFSITAKGQI